MTAVQHAVFTTTSSTSGFVENGQINDGAITPDKADLTTSWNFTGGAQLNGSDVLSVSTTHTKLPCTYGAVLDVQNSPAAGQWSYSSGVLTAFSNGAFATTDTISATPIPSLVGDRIFVFVGADSNSIVTHKATGIYTITTLGGVGTPAVLTRATDANSSEKIALGMTVFILTGDTFSGGYQLSSASATSIVLHTTTLLFTKFAGGGTGMPTATGAGEIPVSDAAGTAYTATNASGVRSLLSVPTSAEVTDMVNSLDAKQAVYSVETRLNITPSGSQTVGGVVVPDVQRVLLTAQTTPSENGFYITNNGGAWFSTSDSNSASKIEAGARVYCQYGDNAGNIFVLSTTGTITPLTTPQTWEMLADSIGATRQTFTQSILGAAFSKILRFYAPVDQAIGMGSLSSGDNPLATMVYNSGTKTITAGINGDVSAFGMPEGSSVLFIFTSANQSTSGPYVVTYAGTNDPGGTPAVFTRRGDFDSSGKIAHGSCFPVTQDNTGNQPGTLHRLEGGPTFTLDTDALNFTEIRLAAQVTIQTVTSNTSSGDGYVTLVDASSGSITISLPPASSARGPIRIKKIDSSANTVTISPNNPTETIDGATTLVLTTQYEAVELFSDNARWSIF